MPQSSQFEVVRSDPQPTTAAPASGKSQFEVVQSTPAPQPKAPTAAASPFEVVQSTKAPAPAPTGASIIKGALPKEGARLWDLLFGEGSRAQEIKDAPMALFHTVEGGMRQVGHGLKGFWSDKTSGEAVKSARDVIEGSAKVLTPAAVVGAVTAGLPATIGAVVLSAGAQKAGDWLGTKMGLSPDLSALGGDIAALAGGYAGFKAGGAVGSAIGDSDPVRAGRGFINPSDVSPEASRTAGLIDQARAKVANFADMQSAEGKFSQTKFWKFWEPKSLEDTVTRLSTDQQIAAISHYDKTGSFPDGLPGIPKEYSQLYKASSDRDHAILERGTGTPVGYVENYLRRAFKYKTPTDEARATPVLVEALKQSKRSLSGNKSVTRHRAFDMPLDQALKAMKTAGIDAEPVTTNFETLRQWTATNATAVETYANFWKTLKAENLIQYVTKKPPRGFVALEDKVATKFFPSEKGMVKGGQYYAHPDVARLLNRAISQGLSNAPTNNWIRATNALMNQFNMSVPIFHALDTALNSMATDLAASIQDFRGARIRPAIGKLQRAMTGASAAAQYDRGSAFAALIKRGDPIAWKVLDDVNRGGHRLALDNSYRTKFTEQMYHAFADKKIAKGIGLSPLAATHLLSKPLMEVAIPRIKTGAYLDLVDAIRARMPGATEEQLTRAFRKAQDSIDNRFGLLTYDNLHWSRLAIDAFQLGIRSVGWQYGTVRELGGGMIDLRKLLRGQGATDRLLFTFMLPIAHAYLASTYQYLHTGKGPEEFTDYFYPKNGLTDENGNPMRSSLPSYINTARNYVTRPPLQSLLSMAGPLITTGIDLLQNENYLGDMTANPDDTRGQRILQRGQFVFDQLMPFGVTTGEQMASQGAPKWRTAEGAFGIKNAPADVTQSKAQQLTSAALHHQLGDRHRTPEEVQVDALRAKARTELKKGDTTTLRLLIQQGAIKNTNRAVNEFKKLALQSSSDRAWHELSTAEKLKVYDALGIPRPGGR